MKRTLLVAAIAALGLIACNKSDLVNTGSPVSQNAPKNILRFDSYEALSLAIDRSLAMAMSPAVMKAPGQEVSNGFVSFGELADMAYEDVAQYQDDYKSIEEVRAAIAQYPDYLQLVEEKDEDGVTYTVETKLEDSPTKYIINEDLMYQVKDTLVKTLENYTIATPVSNYEELLNINEKNVAQYQNDPKFVIVDPLNPLGGSGSSQPNPNLGRLVTTNPSPKVYSGYDGRKHHLTIKFKILYQNTWGSIKVENCYMLIKHTRKGFCGIYWTMKQNISYDFSITICAYGYGQYIYFGPMDRPQIFTGSFYDWKWEKSGGFQYPQNFNAYFTSVTGYVQTPDITVNFY